MARHGTPRRRPEAPGVAPTTLHEITRRYYACAIALAKAMGLPMSETFMREHRESISCCFIEAGRAGVRLPPAVALPPFAAPSTQRQDLTEGAPPRGHPHGRRPALWRPGDQRPQAGGVEHGHCENGKAGAGPGRGLGAP